MKYGVRKPSVRKSVSARTTGRLTRTANRSINPYYGSKGMGWVNDSHRAAYNKVYYKGTISLVFVITLFIMFLSSPIIFAWWFITQFLGF